MVKLLEQYDPEDETCSSQPYAYFADYVIPVKLPVDIGAEMAVYEEKQRVYSQELLSPLPKTTPDQWKWWK